jgi:hypothetical protein
MAENHPTKLRLLNRIKDWVEEKSGLQLGDALNVSLFILTIVSFLVAVGGVYVAYITLVEARESGKSQEQATTQAQQALDQSKNALGVVVAQLDAEKKVLQEELQAAQQQETLLKRSTVAADQMVAALNKIKDAPNTVPILSARINCFNSDGEDSTDTGMLISWGDEQRFRPKGLSHLRVHQYPLRSRIRVCTENQKRWRTLT